MTDDTVQVKFGADTSGMKSETDAGKEAIAGLSRAGRADISSLSAEVAKLSIALQKMSGDVKTAAVSSQTLASYANWAFGLELVKLGFEGVGAAAGGLASLVQGVAVGAANVAVSLDKWAESSVRVQTATAGLRVEDTGLLALLGRTSIAVKDFITEANVYTSSLPQAGLQAAAFAGNLERVNEQAAHSGFQTSEVMIAQFVTQLTRATGASTELASTIENRFLKIPDYTAALNSALITYIGSLNQTKDQAVATANELAKVFSDPLAQGDAFLGTLGKIDNGYLENFRDAKRQLDPLKASEALLNAMAAATKREVDVAKDHYQHLVDTRGVLQSIANINIPFARTGDLTVVRLMEDSYKSLRSTLLLMGADLSAQGRTLTSTEAQLKGIVGNATSLEEQIAKAAAEAKILEGALEKAKTSSQGISTENIQVALDERNKTLASLKEKQDGITKAERDEYAEKKRVFDLGKDELRDAWTKLEAAEKAVNAAGDEGEKIKANTALLDAQTAVVDKQIARDRARAALMDARARTPEDSLAAAKATRDAATNQPIDETQRIQAQATYESAVKASNARIAADNSTTATEDYDRKKSALDGKKMLLEEEVAAGTRSHQSMFGEERSIEGERVALEREHLAKMMTIWADEPRQYLKYKKQFGEIDLASNKRLEEINLQSVKEQEKVWKQLGDSVSSTMAQSITGIITHTQTFRQAEQAIAKDILGVFVKMGTDMVSGFAVALAKMVVQHMGAEAAMTAATEAGAAARAGATLASFAAGGAAEAAAMVKSILGSAAETEAGVTGFLSPLLGPAALPAGVAAGASVAALAGAVPSFAVGAYQMPQSMLSVVHKDELVMTASQGTAFRAALSQLSGGTNAGGSGNNPVSLNVQAVDPRSFMAFMKNNGPAIASMLRDLLNKNPSLRPSF